jgi:hypothetical protein
MFVSDRLTVTNARKTAAGYLVADARFARSGLYSYAGSEVGKPEMDTVVVYRPPEQVFSQDAMASFAHRPITNEHPDTMVDASNWKGLAVGFTDGTVARDGDFVRVPMMVTDAATIAAYDDGKAELSAGYDCELEFTAGTTPEGAHYDATMKDIRGNHIAIVDRGRAGSECRIGDHEGARKMNTKIVLVDGLQVETTDAGAAAIEKLQRDLAAKDTAAATEATGLRDTIAERDRQLAAKDAEITGLKAKVVDGAALDALVTTRATLIDTARRIAPNFDTAGKTDGDIRRGVVAASIGDAAALADKSDDYVVARFDILADAARGSGGGDSLRSAFIDSGSGGGIPMQTTDAARAEQQALSDSITDLNGWRNKKAG